MAVQVGQPAPSFRSRSDDGHMVDLAALRGHWVVLYFYPKASSPGCSLEARQFEQAVPELSRLGAVVVGVSTDTEARQASFRDRCELSFALLPDSDRSICRAYGVLDGLGGWLGLAARQTFLIDPAGTVARQWRKVNPARHAAEVLAALRDIKNAQAKAL